MHSKFDERPDSKLKKVKILVVDDSALTRAIVNKMLKDNFEIIEAHDGFQGLELFKKEKPDLVISDYMMPGMLGTELCGKIRKINSKIPIILNSVQFTKDVKKESEKLKINDYLFKDFEKKDLILKINTLLKR
jgi:PleD family two-component response regulator